MENKISEEEAEKRLTEMELAISDGKGIRKYTSLDMVIFAKLRDSIPNVSYRVLLRIYNVKYPEKSAVEKLNNVMKFIKENDN